MKYKKLPFQKFMSNPYFRKPLAEQQLFELSDSNLEDEISYIEELIDSYGEYSGTSATTLFIPNQLYEAFRYAHAEKRRRISNDQRHTKHGAQSANQ